MNRRLLTGFALLSAAAAAPAFAADTPPAVPTTAPAAARSADQILADLKAVPMPMVDQTKTSDQEYVAQFIRDRTAAMKKRSDLAAELSKAAPDAKELGTVLPERWQFLAQTGQGEAAVGEITAYLAKHPDAPNKAAVASLKAQIVIQLVAKDTPARLAAMEEYKKAAPASPQTDTMLASMLYYMARVSQDEKESADLMARVAKEYPNTPVAQQVQGELKKREAVGKPMELAFTDAVSGKQVSIAGLKGKVVVVDFWATWCGPCVAEMPNMKKLYAEFKDKGVEFLGISLDEPEAEGGLKALKEFVAKNEIGWPQYYQGKGWQSDFSSKWGINSIPAVFVVDADGKIASVDARGKLETLLPELLKKRDAAGGVK